MMCNVSALFRHVREMVAMLLSLIVDAVCYLGLCLRPSPALAAENLFLRQQLALYQERHVKPRQATNAIRLAMVCLSRWFDWRSALSLVKPQTLTRWPRQGFRLVWRWKSKPGRPQRWAPFLRNHAKGIMTCDFCVAVTATFRILYVFVVIEQVSRRLLHLNVTAHPTARWTTQQFREAIPADHTYHILIPDRDAIFSKAVDQSARHMRLHVIKTPVRTPVANSICEHVIGTMCRECLDFVIPVNERHLGRILEEWVAYYNQGCPHMSLGPGIPLPIHDLPMYRQAHRHGLRSDQCVISQPILSGLHQDYRLEKKAA